MLPIAVAGLVAAAAPYPVFAQVAIEGALQSDFRLRGYSISRGHPVVSGSLEYDDPSGFYAGGMASGTIDHGEPQLVLLEGHAGFAARLSPGWSVDAGVTHSQYGTAFGPGREYHYTELYVGVATRSLGARLSYSPNYYFSDVHTLYGEINGGAEVAPDWLVSAHLGGLFYVDSPLYGAATNTRYDWRLGVSRRLGPYAVHADVSGRVQDTASGLEAGKAAAVLTLTRAF